MTSRLSSIIAFCLFTSLNFYAQEEQPITCGSDDIHHKLLSSDKNYERKYRAFQRTYRQRLVEKVNGTARSTPVYTIPVVVHIIHDGSPLGSVANPTDDEIATIVVQASQRFRHMHSGAEAYTNPNYGADTEIELCLASQDPSGNYTSGVTRHLDPTNAVGDYGDIASALNAHAWDKAKYCNLYIVKNLTNASGVYLGGSFDFTIYTSPAFWSGLIAHELGHYFNLRHTFDGACNNGNCDEDGDEVCDTPPKEEPGFGTGDCVMPGNSCTTDDVDTSTINPYRPAANGGIGDQPDMLANYMDYTGSCWDSFTEGQKMRMRTDIDTDRVALKNNSTACNGSAPAHDAGITAVVLNQADPCTASFNPQVTMKNYGTSMLSSANIVVKIDGSHIVSQPWSGGIPSGSTVNFTFTLPVSLSIGESIIEFATELPNGSMDANSHNDSDFRKASYIGGTSCSSYSDCTNFNTSSASGPGNTTIVNIAATFPNTSSSVQICVTTEGDVSSGAEIFNVLDESGTLRGQTNPGSDCGGPTESFCFTVGTTEYNNWKSDGQIIVTFDPVSTQINPLLCSTHEACAEINIPQGSSCDPIVMLDGTITTGLYQAGNYINANGVILDPSNVTMGSTNYTTLTQGFEVETGAILEISLTGCN